MNKNRQIPDFSGTEIVEIAIEIEKNGRDFYNAFSGRLKDKDIKELFRCLSIEEANHIEDFKKIFDSVSSHNPCESYPQDYFAYLNAIASEYVFTKKDELKERIGSISSEKEAIDISIGLEKDSILFYEEMKKIVPDKDSNIIDTIIDQEKEHAKRLLAIKARLIG